MIAIPTLLYAHRGACLKLPENTIEAFRAGLEDGANALEMDVHRTKDDVIVVFHDHTGKRVAGENVFVKDCAFEQISHWSLSGLRVPTFEQVLETFTDVPINVDIKDNDPKTVHLVVDLINKAGAQNRVRLTGANSKVFKMIREANYDGPLGMGAQDLAALYFLPKFILKNRFAGRAAQVPLKQFGIKFAQESFIDKCHDLGLRVDFWVVNDVDTAQELLDMGADGIMSDDPKSIAECFTSGLKSPS